MPTNTWTYSPQRNTAMQTLMKLSNVQGDPDPAIVQMHDSHRDQHSRKIAGKRAALPAFGAISQRREYHLNPDFLPSSQVFPLQPSAESI